MLVLFSLVAVITLSSIILTNFSPAPKAEFESTEREVVTVSTPDGRAAVDFQVGTYTRPITLTVEVILSAPIIEQYSAMNSVSVEAFYIEKPLLSMNEPFVLRFAVPPVIRKQDPVTELWTETIIHDPTIFKFVRGAGWVKQDSVFDGDKHEVRLQSTELGTYALASPKESPLTESE